MSTASDASVYSMGSRRELFLDDFLVESFQGGAHLRYHQPQRQGLALEFDQPWEGSGSGYPAILAEEDRFRLYYKAWNIPQDGDTSRPVYIGYAESPDGIHWEKPSLGRHTFDGNQNNNILLMDGLGLGNCHDFSPFRDSRPGVEEAGQYKAVGHIIGTSGVAGFQSRDGLDWKLVQPEVLFTEPEMAFDSQNLAFWSKEEGAYLLYYRVNVDGVRSIARAVSKDFIHWEKQGLLKFPSGGGPCSKEQFYTNQIQPYYRAPHLRLGFPARYVDRGWLPGTEELPSLEFRRQRAEKQTRFGSAVTDSVLIYSRDGRAFKRRPEPFLIPGPRQVHNWAYGDNYLAWPLIETASAEDDSPPELSLYAIESYFTPPSSRLRRYTLRIDGFGSIAAWTEPGTVLTKPLIFEGSRLTLNCSTSAAGQIKVELLTAEGSSLPPFGQDECLEIFGDFIDRKVHWSTESKLESLRGKPVRLKFYLKEAEVFSFQFEGE